MHYLRLVIVTALWFASYAAAQTIQTIAGAGPRNQDALQTGLNYPDGIATDPSGNVFVSVNHQIWKITPAGRVSVFANTSGGYLATDSLGNLYFASSAQILRVSPSGLLTVVAGDGKSGYSGDGGPASAARVSTIRGLVIDSSNNLYFADYENERIRMITPSGIISTVAGNGLAGITGEGGIATSTSIFLPIGVAVSSSGTVYFGDAGTSRVRKFTVGGTISTAAGNGTARDSGDNGPATAAGFAQINQLAVDSAGNLFIAEILKIRKVAANTGTITTYAGIGSVVGATGDGGPATSAGVWGVSGMAFDSTGSMFIADQLDLRIRKISAAGIISTFAGDGTKGHQADGIPALDSFFLFSSSNYPVSLAADNAGNLLFTDPAFYGIRSLSLGQGTLAPVALNGSISQTGPDSYTAYPGFPTFNKDGLLFFADNGNLRELKNGFSTTVAPGRGPLAIASNGNIYFASADNTQIFLYSAATGTVTNFAGTGTSGSTGDGGPALSATLGVSALALDGARYLYICSGNRIRKIDLATNIITTAVGGGGIQASDGFLATSISLGQASSIFVDDSGNVFFADSSLAKVFKVDGASGVITTVVGNGTTGFSGDGGPALSASISPLAITIDRSQNLYLMEKSNRIRQTKVSACFFTFSAPSFSAGKQGSMGSMTFTATNANCPYSVSSSSLVVAPTSGASGVGGGTITFAIGANTGPSRTVTLNIGGASFDVQQAGVSGPANIGFFNPNGPQWVLDSNGSGAYESTDRAFPFVGQPGATAVTGDWNGDGRTKVGFYLNGFWALDYNGNGVWDGPSGGDKFYAFGGSGSTYVPVVGDWNGDGKTKIGYNYAGFWYLDMNGNGQWDGQGQDTFIALGGRGAGEVPLVGDWNGSGRTKVGFYHQGIWALDYDGDGTFTATDKYFTAFPYAAGDKPVVGDWTGDGKTKIGVFRNGFWVLDMNNNGTYDGVGAGGDKFYGFGGNTGEVPVVADWNGSGTSKIGVFVNGFWILDYNGNGSWDGLTTDRFIPFGASGVQPIIGRW